MKKHLALALALAALPAAATASELGYTYVEGGYAKTHVNEDLLDDPELDGAYLRGSFALNEQVYLYGGFDTTSGDVAGFDIDETITQLGVGYRFAVSERADLLGELAFVRDDFDVDGIDGSSNGGRVNVGIRGAMSPSFEGWLKAGYLDGGDFDGEFVGSLGGQFKIRETWGIVVEAEFLDQTTFYRAGVRASF